MKFLAGLVVGGIVGATTIAYGYSPEECELAFQAIANYQDYCEAEIYEAEPPDRPFAEVSCDFP